MAIFKPILESLQQNQVLVAILVILSFPGPKLWAASRLPYIYCLLTGQLIRREREFHEKYGDFLRLAPDEVSFANEEAWTDIYSFRRGHKRALRDKAYYIDSQVDNLITTNDPKFHARIRGLLSNSFTEDSLRTQHSLIQSHADMLVSQLLKLASTPDDGRGTGARVNMTDWLNFFTMDVIADLAFGEPFGCLKEGEYHQWVRTLFSYLKSMSLAAAPRYYPTTEFLFQKLIPKSVLEGQKRHTQFANQMINRRLDSKSERPDFMTPFMKNNVNFENMSREEILSSFNFIIVGGSETSATVLTGIFNHLSKKENKHILQRLCKDIRWKFKDEDSITIDAIQDLPYLEAVLNEGLRICNPIPGGLPRVVPEGGDTFCGVYLPGGTRLAVRTFAVNRSKRLFANPDTFVPERWLQKGQRPSEYDGDHLSASKPFSVGFHSCLGRPLAWVELRLVVTRLLWAFDLSVDAGDEVNFDDFPVIMLIQKLAMNMRLKARPGARYKGA
ncbi:Versicolorin B desaturase [Lachnellula suecica]|uniref:Versicolorin B desaturase n=1 Tax=Lachnellula suecica TaxID=602035 RepID=A0A8T9CAT0_9HELO|nr:Versicolorin B desaturase [Lachnellula suecica]